MTQGQAGGYGAAAGAVIGGVTSVIGLRSQNKQIISNIENEGNTLQSQMRMINLNREQLDRELGDVLSDNALATAKNMATAKVAMSMSGTVGGTSAQVSKQAYMEQIMADADAIAQARNSEKGMLMDAISKRIQFNQRANAYRSQIASPLAGFMQTLGSAMGMASQGAQLGVQAQGLSSAKMTPLQSQTSQQAVSMKHRTGDGSWGFGTTGKLN